MKSSGFIEIDMFPKEINRLNDPEVTRFKRLLLEVAEGYDCFLVSFEIDHGTVIFSFDSDELTAEILTILRNDRES
ncbi:MAG: hypothetical protein JRJ15_04140 [Deltaproteobacteria bacterium]|nr:hypothetical protein [Deltaproteobacteria bacterium]